MDRKEFTVFAAALKTYYSREQHLLENGQAMELWYRQLSDIPYKVAEASLNKWVAVNKWSPSIADIREYASGITEGKIKDWSEAFEDARRAIRRFGSYNPQEALASLDEMTRETVKRLGYTDLCTSENHAADRANFRMIYEQLATRQREDRCIPEQVRKMIESVQSGIEDKRRA